MAQANSMWRSEDILPCCWRRGLVAVFPLYVRLDDLWTSGDSHISTSYLPMGVQESQRCLLHHFWGLKLTLKTTASSMVVYKYLDSSSSTLLHSEHCGRHYLTTLVQSSPGVWPWRKTSNRRTTNSIKNGGQQLPRWTIWDILRSLCQNLVSDDSMLSCKDWGQKLDVMWRAGWGPPIMDTVKPLLKREKSALSLKLPAWAMNWEENWWHWMSYMEPSRITPQY